MQTMYFTTSVTDKGYILLPVKVRNALNLKPRQTIQLKVDNTGVRVTPLMRLDEVFSFVKPTKRRFTQKELKEEERIAHQAIVDNVLSEGV